MEIYPSHLIWNGYIIIFILLYKNIIIQISITVETNVHLMEDVILN